MLGLRRPRRRVRHIDADAVRAEPNSLSRQKERVYQLAAQNGLEIVRKPFIDVASGWKNTLTRIMWNHMRNYCEHEGIATIICFDVSRFGRPEKMLDLTEVVGWFEQRRMRILGGGYDFDLGQDRMAALMFFFTMWSHGSDSGRHSRNMLDAYGALRKLHLHPTSQRAFGFAKSTGEYGGKRRSCFLPDPDEAEIVMEVFSRIADGGSCKLIAADLQERGVPTVMGGIWNHSHIKAMIRKPIYIGKYMFDGVLEDALNVPALVPASLWEEANALLDRSGELYKRQRQPATARGETAIGRGGRTSAHALYDGLLVCGVCGSNLALTHGHKHVRKDGGVSRYIHYRCRSSYHHAGCLQPAVPEGAITAWLLEHSATVFSPTLWQERQAGANDEADKIRSELITVDSQVANFEKMIADPGLFDPARLKAAAAPALKKQRTLRERLATIEEAAAEAARIVTIEDVAEVFKSRDTLKKYCLMCVDSLAITDKQVVEYHLRHEGIIPETLVVPPFGIGSLDFTIGGYDGHGDVPVGTYQWEYLAEHLARLGPRQAAVS